MSIHEHSWEVTIITAIGAVRSPEEEQGTRDARLYRMLRTELASAGCFRPAPVHAALYGACIVGGYLAAYGALLAGPRPALRILALGVLAFLSVHAGFLAHEAGHGALTPNRRAIPWIGQVFNTFLTALCYSYYSHIHRQHHPHCNDRSRDPDMQSGFFSLYPEAAREKSGLGRLISRHQSVLIWILVCLQPFTLKIDSIRFMRRRLRTTRVDQIVLVLHWAMWLGPPTLALGLP